MMVKVHCEDPTALVHTASCRLSGVSRGGARFAGAPLLVLLLSVKLTEAEVALLVWG